MCMWYPIIILTVCVSLMNIAFFMPPFLHPYQINTADHSDSQWMTCFQDTGSEILGVPAQELGHLRDTDDAAFDLVFQQANFKDFVFKARAKVDTYNVSIPYPKSNIQVCITSCVYMHDVCVFFKKHLVVS